MEVLIPILILVVIVAVAVWIINMIPFPAGLEIVKTILMVVVGVLALIRLFSYL